MASFSTYYKLRKVFNLLNLSLQQIATKNEFIRSKYYKLCHHSLCKQTIGIVLATI